MRRRRGTPRRYRRARHALHAGQWATPAPRPRCQPARRRAPPYKFSLVHHRGMQGIEECRCFSRDLGRGRYRMLHEVREAPRSSLRGQYHVVQSSRRAQRARDTREEELHEHPEKPPLVAVDVSDPVQLEPLDIIHGRKPAQSRGRRSVAWAKGFWRQGALAPRGFGATTWALPFCEALNPRVLLSLLLLFVPKSLQQFFRDHLALFALHVGSSHEGPSNPWPTVSVAHRKCLPVQGLGSVVLNAHRR